MQSGFGSEPRLALSGDTTRQNSYHQHTSRKHYCHAPQIIARPGREDGVRQSRLLSISIQISQRCEGVVRLCFFEMRFYLWQERLSREFEGSERGAARGPQTNVQPLTPRLRIGSFRLVRPAVRFFMSPTSVACLRISLGDSEEKVVLYSKKSPSNPVARSEI